MRRAAASLAATIALVPAAPAAAGTWGGDVLRTCHPRGAVTVAESRLARVFYNPRDRRAQKLYGCLYRRRRAYSLDGISYGYWIQRNTVALTGTRVAFAATEDNGDTFIDVNSLRSHPTIQGRLRPELPIPLSRGGDGEVDVGSLIARRNLALAWITCLPRGWPFGTGPGSSCGRADNIRRVFRLSSTATERERLDRGRRIEAGSLRLRGDRIAWTHAGARRTAALR